MLKLKIKEAKQRYNNVTLREFLQASPQKFWDHINPKKSKTASLRPSEKQRMADEFNSYFESVYSTENGNTVSFLTPNNDSEGLGSLTVTEPGVLALLLELDTHKKVTVLTKFHVCS